MPQDAKVWISGFLTDAEIEQAICALPEILRGSLGDCIVICWYGYGTDLHPALQWVNMEVHTQALDRFVKDSLRQQIVLPGRSDIGFRLPGQRGEILFDHEGEIVLRAEDEWLLTQLQNDPCFRNL